MDGNFLAGFKAGTDFLIDYLTSSTDDFVNSDITPIDEFYRAICEYAAEKALDENQRLIELALQGKLTKTDQD